MQHIESDDFVVEFLGEQEIDVYDIEVDSNHNFFANDILVHNSIYMNLNDIIVKTNSADKDELTIVNILDQFYEDKISPLIKKTQKNLANNLGCRDAFIKVKREAIASKSIFLAKKRYIQLVQNSEGVHYKIPKLKMTGVEAIKSTTPNSVKGLFLELFRIMLTEGEKKSQEFLAEKFNLFCELPYDEIAYNGKVSDILKYTGNESLGEDLIKPKCPKKVRGAIYYNKLLKDKGLLIKYNQIFPGDSVKTLNLRMPNPIRSDVIAYNDSLPTEFGLEKYIDYDDMWEVCFLKPIRDIMNVCGWETESQNTLDRFFG